MGEITQTMRVGSLYPSLSEPVRVSNPDSSPSGTGLARIQGQHAKPRGAFEGRGYHYTSWGSNHSLGSLTTSALKVLTLSTAARWAGAKIQDGHSTGARYWAGAMVKGLANITSGVAGLVGGAISWGEAVVSNLGNAALHLQLGQPSKISFLSKGKQQDIPQELAQKALPRVFMASKAYDDAGDYAMPSDYKPIRDPAEIPPALLSKEHGGTGKMGLMKLDEGRLISDGWSAMRVGVFTGPQNEIYLAFAGTEPTNRPGSLKSDLVQGLGIKDTAYHDADKIVKAFKAHYPGREIHLLGHSLGGGLATYAGIKNQLPVTAFNAAGLSLGLRNELGADAIDQAQVTHINTSNDPLSQKVENRRFGVLPTSQVGDRYKIPNSGGHGILTVFDGLKAAARQTDYAKPRQANSME
jgi:hypothetical protein